MRTSQSILTMTIVALAAIAASGCATRKGMETYVAGETAVIDERIDGVESQVETNQTRIDDQGRRIDDQDRQLAELSTTTREALERALAAGKLAEGKFLYETVLTDEKVRFGFDKAELSDEARAALDEFATRLRAEDENVFVEIQGHTDTIGSESYNLELGASRAEAVRRYLNLRHGLPLHRLSVISYGESAPLVDDSSREGRSQNRRVALVVLK
jgi:outer membrane protein OmpA-like peptidoglycan-associated protein